MTKEAWFNIEKPDAMLKFLQRYAKSRWLDRFSSRKSPLSDRQLRLFICGCCHRLWPLLDEQSQDAVNLAERYADEKATIEDLRNISAQVLTLPGVRWWRGWRSKVFTYQMQDPYDWAQGMACAAITDPDRLWSQALRVAGLDGVLSLCVEEKEGELRVGPLDAQDLYHSWIPASPSPSVILRDIVGNPFWIKPSASTVWLTWNNEIVVKLAKSIDSESHFQHMTILGDALEEAGCDNQEILQHCRQQQSHVRGCWVIDWCLGKK
jgi:hypothetical protein